MNERFAIFAENLEKIDGINSQNLGWNADVNKFSDMTWDEFQHFYLMESGQDCSATNVNGPDFISKDGIESIKNFQNYQGN